MFYNKNKTTHKIQTTGMFKQNTNNHVVHILGKPIWESFFEQILYTQITVGCILTMAREMIKYDQSWLF
jgi:hypothetical protein